MGQGSKTTYMENLILKWLTGKQANTQLTVYLGLFNTPPTDAGAGSGEVSGGSYARVKLNTPPGTNTYFGSAASNSQIATTADITFPTPSADWGYVNAVGIFDASTAGNLLLWATIPPKQIVQNSAVVFPAGAIVIGED